MKPAGFISNPISLSALAAGSMFSFFGFLGLIDKHLKTLVKMLRELISKCDDPKIIEHTQKQIKSIESLLEEVKLSLSAHGGTAVMGDAANRLIESFF